jgi:thiol-disulfide isomerase/thioredoxin
MSGPLYAPPIEISASDVQHLESLKPGLIMFYAHWCGHCKNMKETWEALHKQKGKTHSVLAIDCAASENSQVCAKMGAEAYPTIKFVKNGRLSDYNGRRELEPLLAALSNGGMRGGGPTGAGAGGMRGGRRKSTGKRMSTCSGKTADGSVCKRAAQPGRKRCWQHRR